MFILILYISLCTQFSIFQLTRRLQNLLATYKFALRVETVELNRPRNFGEAYKKDWTNCKCCFRLEYKARY